MWFCAPLEIVFFSGLVLYLFFFLQYIHSYNHLLKTFAEAHLHIFIAIGQWAEPPWGAEPRFELGPALQQVSALASELRFTLLIVTSCLHKGRPQRRSLHAVPVPRATKQVTAAWEGIFDQKMIENQFFFIVNSTEIASRFCSNRVLLKSCTVFSLIWFFLFSSA
jgi:hypothetical protein